MKWEYIYLNIEDNCVSEPDWRDGDGRVTVFTDWDTAVLEMNALGNQGWELVGTLSGKAIFKRPLGMGGEPLPKPKADYSNPMSGR